MTFSSKVGKQWKYLCHFEKVAKGQLISKCPFGVNVWTKIPMKSDLASKKRLNQKEVKALNFFFNYLKFNWLDFLFDLTSF